MAQKSVGIMKVVNMLRKAHSKPPTQRATHFSGAQYELTQAA